MGIRPRKWWRLRDHAEAATTALRFPEWIKPAKEEDRRRGWTLTRERYESGSEDRFLGLRVERL